MGISRRTFIGGLTAGTISGCRLLSNNDDFPTYGLIAHRGDAAEYPESTIPAFRSAVVKGAEMIELDEWRCKTGELVVMHDPTVDCTTDGKGQIADLTLAEIKALDAGMSCCAAVKIIDSNTTFAKDALSPYITSGELPGGVVQAMSGEAPR